MEFGDKIAIKSFTLILLRYGTPPYDHSISSSAGITVRPILEQKPGTSKMRFQQARNKTFHPKPPPTTHQQSKHSKLPFVSPLIVFRQRVHHIRIEKQIHIFSIPREKIRLFMIWFFDLLLIRPLMYTHSRSPKTLYPLYQM